MGQKIPCSLCFFLPSPFREWSPLDPLRQQAGVEHGLKENQQQRNEPKHPKQVVTYLPSSPRAMPPSRSQKVDGDSYSQPEPRRYSCLPPGGKEPCSQGVGRWWEQCSSGEPGADQGRLPQLEGARTRPCCHTECRGFGGTLRMPAGVLQSVSWGYSGKMNSQTTFCAGKVQVRVQGSVLRLRMEMGAYRGQLL